MADLERRLANCFALVFPSVAPQEIPLVSMASMASWDSLAGITLISLIEEEFAITVSPDDAPDLVSFELTLDFLRRPQPNVSA